MSDSNSHEISYDNAYPNAQKLMREPFFYSIIDSSAPFGSDDTWETFQELYRWLPSNKSADKIDFIHQQVSYWGYPYFNLRSLDITEILGYINSSPIEDRFLIGIDETNANENNKFISRFATEP